MATLTTQLSQSLKLGGRTVEAFTRPNALVCTEAYDQLQIVGTSTETLWSAAADSPATFKSLTVIIDPDETLSTAINVEVEFTVAGQTFVLVANRNHPITLGPSTARATIGGSDLNVTLVRAKAASGTVPIRILVLN